MWGVIYDRMIAARVKKMAYKMVVTPAVMSSLETVPPTKRQEAELEREGSNGLGVCCGRMVDVLDKGC